MERRLIDCVRCGIKKISEESGEGGEEEWEQKNNVILSIDLLVGGVAVGAIATHHFVTNAANVLFLFAKRQHCAISGMRQRLEK